MRRWPSKSTALIVVSLFLVSPFTIRLPFSVLLCFYMYKKLTCCNAAVGFVDVVCVKGKAYGLKTKNQRADWAVTMMAASISLSTDSQLLLLHISIFI